MCFTGGPRQWVTPEVAFYPPELQRVSTCPHLKIWTTTPNYHQNSDCSETIQNKTSSCDKRITCRLVKPRSALGLQEVLSQQVLDMFCIISLCEIMTKQIEDGRFRPNRLCLVELAVSFIILSISFQKEANVLYCQYIKTQIVNTSRK